MPAVVGDIFGLGDVYIRQVSPVTVGIDTSGNFITVSGWSDLRSHGWFGGGYSIGPTFFASVDRIDFSNDSIRPSVRGILSSTKNYLTATGNSNYGWFGGGVTFPGSLTSIIDRINFSNDSVTASIKNNLLTFQYILASTGNNNFGWFGGGTDGSAPLSRIDRINFFNDTSALSPRGPLSNTKYYLGATGNSNYGWFGGGYRNAPTQILYSTVDRVDFSNDLATASPRGSFISPKLYPAATANSNYAWFGGGFDGGSVLSIIDRIDFSNDTAIPSPRGPLSLSRYNTGASGNSNYGWFGGGEFLGPSITNRVDRIDFSNDSATALLRNGLIATRSRLSSTSGQANSSSILLQKAGNFGWFGGGLTPATPAPSPSTRIDRINFSNDLVTASIRGSLSLGRNLLAASGNSNYGWFGGGLTPTPSRVTTVDRVDFSNDAVTSSSRNPLGLARYFLGATSNSHYGWFCGGNGSIPGAAPFVHMSSIERLNFLNDSVTASRRGFLSVAKSGFGASGNSNYGWFGGGYNPALGAYPNSLVSTVDRMDFTNDSATASPRGPLSSAKYYLGATGNSNYGWFGGGFSTIPAPGSPISTIDRMDFSNDSTAASVRGPLTSARRNVHATGNSNYGWFSGDFSPAILSVVDRVNFSNDTGTALLRSPLSATRYGFTATANTPIG